MMHGQKNIKSW